MLKEAGADVPEGLQLKVVENTERLVHLILPPRPESGELSDEQLESVAGGFFDAGRFGVRLLYWGVK